MGLSRKNRHIDTGAEDYWEAAGLKVLHQTYESMGIQIHPNDLRVRVPPDPPYTEAWAGVQKANPVAGVGVHYQRMGGNPMHRQRANAGATQLINPTPSFFGTGPYTARNQSQEELDLQMLVATEQPGLFKSLLSRLRGQ